jgi:hypothetical protein
MHVEFPVLPKPFIELDPREEAAFVEGFSNFHTPQQVLGILDTIPSQEVTPVVSLSILRKLFELENNFGFRNEGRSWVITTENSSIETFARMAIVSRLVDIVILGDDTTLLLEALDILRVERKLALRPRNQLEEDAEESEPENENPSSERLQEFSNYRGKLCDEILIRTIKGKLNLPEVCRAICSMGQMERQFPNEIRTDFIDKMWTGILDRGNEIEITNIVQVFKTIQYFKKSRRLVMNLVERKFLSLWWRLEPETVAEICDLLLMKEAGPGSVSSQSQKNIFNTKQYWGIVSTRLLMSLSRAISLNLHQVTESQLLKVLKTFHALNFCDRTVEKVGPVSCFMYLPTYLSFEMFHNFYYL